MKTSIGPKRTLAFKLSLIVLASTLAIFLLAFGMTYYTVRGIMVENAEREAGELAQSTSYRIFSTLNAVMAAADPAVAAIEEGWLEPSESFPVLRELVSRSPHISGAAYAFEPFSVDPEQEFYAPFVFAKNGELQETFLGGEDFRYFVRDWYQVPRESGRSFWTDPFMAEGGADEMIASFAHPLYADPEDPGSFVGVLALDVSMDGLLEMVSEVSIYDTGFAFLVSSSGNFVTYPEDDFVRRESFFTLAETWQIPELREIGRAMQRGHGFVRLPEKLIGEPARLAFTPLPGADWTLAIVVPESELFGDIVALMRLVLFIATIGFGILLVVIIGVTRSITLPLKKLVAKTAEIAKGNLDEALPPHRSDDEVGVLARSFDEMRVSLKDYINNLTETTKAKERIESELLIARKIQMSFLPKKYTLPQKVQDLVSLQADLISAKHVGGDLYDYFVQDDRYLHFAVGDVSDKGVPAALFMAVTKTLYKGVAEHSADPGEILAKVNDELCLNNENGMFVTYVCGRLDLTTGELLLANAGHNLPLILRRGRSADWVDLEPGLVLGAMEDFVFPVRKLTLHPGDRLILYTDGVVEAENSDGQLFGDEKLRRLAGTHRDKPVSTMVDTFFSEVKDYANGAEQSDDITVLVLEYLRQ
ncbi:MAG: SpoIIE family protein phosphatase [Opitutales bacterium]|nr:SpoIIE family protein phosphatase [Opitutales bacterium]